MREIMIYHKALWKWGLTSQVFMFFEEMGELLQAMGKQYRKHDPKELKHLAEEITDVEIMLEQMKIAFDCGECCEEWKKIKLERLQVLLERE